MEIDKYAMASFNAIHGTNFEVQDIVEYNKVFEDLDLITHGSPCQDFSVAGKQAGGDLGSGTRSSLMYETIRIVGQNRPKYVLWENVKNLLSAKHKHNFDKYIETMNTLGYNSYYQVLNAKDYGVPQNRERVFVVSIRKDIDKGNFEFPQKEELKLRLKDMLEDKVDKKYYISDTMIQGFIKHNENHKEKGTGFIWKPKSENDIANTLRANAALCPTDNTIKVIGNLDIKGHDSVKRVYSKEGLSPTLTDIQGGNRQPKIMTSIPYVNRKYDEFVQEKGYIPEMFNPYNKTEIKDIAPSQTTQCGSVTSSATVLKNERIRIRKLTPKECWRLMGFSDEDFEKAQNIPTSNTQLYKQAGNSICVPVLEKIFKNLLEVK